MRVSHVVYGEDEASRVVVDGLANLVDEALLELEADLLARLGESDGAVAAGLRHLELGLRGLPIQTKCADQVLKLNESVTRFSWSLFTFHFLITTRAADDVTRHGTTNESFTQLLNAFESTVRFSILNQEGRYIQGTLIIFCNLQGSTINSPFTTSQVPFSNE